MEVLSDTAKTSKLSAYLGVIRPYQWVKNLLVFAPVFFAGKLLDLDLIGQAVGAGVLFSITASLGYVINDWKDREEDRAHPTKCMRPFARGVLDGIEGLLIGVILLAIFVGCALLIRPTIELMACVMSYFLLSLLYSYHFKKVAILEIFMVAFFYVIRILAGGTATSVPVSNWLFSTVFFLALLITGAKRKSEILAVGVKAKGHRASLGQYKLDFLNLFLWTVAGVSVVTYALYTVENDHNLVLTVVPATYGVVRFLYLTDFGKGGDPIMTLVKDAHLSICTVVFLLFICYRIYG